MALTAEPETGVPAENQSEGDKERLKLVVNHTLAECEPYHKKWVEKTDRFWGLYRGYSKWHKEFESADPPGRDALRRDAQQTWGTELFIPMCFRTVEAMLPRLVANRPEMIAEPEDPISEQNVESVESMTTRQQEQIDWELKLQTAIKYGLVGGLGIGKTRWRHEQRRRRRLVGSQAPRSLNPTGLAMVDVIETIFDDPDFEAVDPRDWMWDPFGVATIDLSYCIHRTWRTFEYVQRMAQNGVWRNLEDLRFEPGADSEQKWDEVHRDRRNIEGLEKGAKVHESRKRRVHEVLEYHDGDQVITVLDRRVVVQSGENPNWHGDMPFQAYRPMELVGHFHGQGVVEPIEQLQEEINALRSDRRDNARLILQKVLAFHDGMVEADDLKFGPGLAIPTHGDPRELLFPIQVGDIPYAGYQEEDRLMGDFERTSGMSDLDAGGGGQSGTATEAQIGHAAMSARIELMVRRAELELMQPATQQMFAMTQQRVRSDRTVRVEKPPSPGQPDRQWEWRRIGPAELAGEFTFKSKRGSSQAENRPQEQEEGRVLWQAFQGNPLVDQRRLVEHTLKKYGVKDLNGWLAPPNPTVSPAVLDQAVENVGRLTGGNPEIMQLVQAAIAEAMKEELPNMMSGSANGASPIPAPA